MPAIFESNFRTGEYLISEANDYRSREQGDLVIPADGKVDPCTVLGLRTADSKLLPLDPAAVDGTQNAIGILWEGAHSVDGSEQKRTYHARDCEVILEKLAFADTVTQPQKDAAIAELKALGIVVRSAR